MRRRSKSIRGQIDLAVGRIVGGMNAGLRLNAVDVADDGGGRIAGVDRKINAVQVDCVVATGGGGSEGVRSGVRIL